MIKSARQLFACVTVVIAFVVSIQSVYAACAAAPVGNSADTLIQMVASGGIAGIGPASNIISTSEGSIIYDNTDNVPKYCDNTSWVPMRSNDFQRFTVSGTWVKPASGTYAKIECWGGGGGGGRGTQRSTGGGGGGYNHKQVLLSSLGSTETVTIGVGGPGATATGAGTAGGNTTFGAVLTAYGGGAGTGVNSGATLISGGGGGGWRSAGVNGTPGNPLIVQYVTDGDGSAGITAYYYQGQGTNTGAPVMGIAHGGGGAGSDGTASTSEGASAIFGGGGGGSGATGKAGGYSIFGGDGGAASSSSGVAASAGSQPGGGGGSGRSANGGNGGNGMCQVTVF